MRKTSGVPQGFDRLGKTALSGIEQPEVVPSSVRLLYSISASFRSEMMAETSM